MPEPNSRYADVPVAVLPAGDGEGRELRYLRRRFLPAPESLPTLAVHNVVAGDRLDLITAHYLGDPELFWQVCDAALVLHPEELTDRVGGTVRIPFPR
ncbi:MAG: LysM domain-containing protein [Actinoplanes sp.]